MMTRWTWFNIFLLATVFALGLGCKGPGKTEELAAVRFHVEVNPDGTDRNNRVPIGRSALFTVNVTKEAFLTEYQLNEAMLVETNDGFLLRLAFDQKGTWLLEQYTSTHRGKRTAVFAQWGEQMRWLAAPIMENRVTNGVFMFTPDATREEAEQLVIGLNKSAKEIQSGRF